MKKLLLMFTALFMFTASVDAETFYSNLCKNVLVGEALELYVMDIIGVSEEYTENITTSISYNSAYLDGTLVGTSGEESVCTEAVSESETVMGCISETHDYSGISFTKPGTYTITVKLTGTNIPDGIENSYEYAITYVVLEEEYRTSETINVLVNEKFTIDTIALAESQGYTEIGPGGLGFSDLVTQGIFNEGDSCSMGSESGCSNDTGVYEGLYFTKPGTYEIKTAYTEYLSESAWVYHYHTFNFVVSESTKIDVTGSETEVTVDNTAKIENMSDSSVISEIIVPTENNLNTIEVSSDEFTKAAQNEVSLVYEVKNEDEELMYSWSFDSKKLKEDAAVDMNLHLSTSEIDKDLETEFKKDNSLLITFAYHGNLPGEAKVKIYVGDKYKAKDVVDFYYNNEDTGKLELIEEGLVVDKDGYVTVTITHCSEYVLDLSDTKALDDEPKMGNSINLTWIILGASLISASIYLTKKERKVN